MKKAVHYLYFFFLLLLTACGGAGRKERSLFLKQFQSGQYEQALSYLDKQSFYKEEKSRLLYFLEKGTLLHTMGQYRRSIEALQKAKELSRRLYTISLSAKFKTAIANDSYDKYYGESYERSHIHFYLALNHFLIYQKGEYEGYTIKASKAGEKDKSIATKKLSKEEKRKELMAARAEIVDWDSTLNSMKTAKGSSRSVFKNDLMARTFGAFIHEAVGTRNDEQTALQLYKDAKDLLFKNYNSYQTFNMTHRKFIKDFVKLKKMRLNEVKDNYVVQTPFQNELNDYLDYKILSLTKRIRPRDFKRQMKLINPNSQVKNRLKEKSKKANVGIVFQRGLTPAKVADKHYYGLGAVLNNPNSSAGAKALATIGSAVFTVFAAKQLGLLSPPAHYNPGQNYAGFRLSEAMVQGVAIKFELPKIANRPIREKTTLKVLKKDDGTEVYTQNLTLVNPIGDIAEQAIAENSASRFARTGLRVAGKHVTAIIAAYATYKAMKKNNKLIAKLAAVAAYAGASKGIENSEKADTRYWSTLPGDLRFTDFYLPKGEYKLQAILQTEGSQAPRVYHLGDLNVENEKQTYLVNYRSKN